MLHRITAQYRLALATLIVLLLALGLRFIWVQSMALHMLVQIPLLLLAGILIGKSLHDWLLSNGAKAIKQWLRAQAKSWNQHGIPGFIYAMFATTFWMIPKALDSVLLYPEMEVAKVFSLIIAGQMVYDSWHRAHPVIKVFFIGGFCWVSAVVGMLYQESPQRLCNFYLLDDQLITGIGLVIIAIAIPTIWALFAWHKQKAH